MTPGPTYVSEEVRTAMAQPITHHNLDDSFFETYKETTHLLQKIMHTKNEVLILSGEGILGLEAACASLIEPGDRVLVLSNGIFGEGFADFVKLYAGECIFYRQDDRTPFDVDDLEAFLEKDHDFKLATLVHCETPSGLINPIDQICPLLKKHHILTIVDAVSSVGGMPIETDEWEIDLLLGGSQKCLSAPTGLTFLSLSDQANQAIHNRKEPIRSYYCNLTIWDDWYDKKWFPYSQPISDIYALHEAALRHVEDKTIFDRHRKTANYVRDELVAMGLELYPHSGYSDTVTAFLVPTHIHEKAFRDTLWHEKGILIAGSLGSLKGKILRIGHMGENCYEDKIDYCLKAIRELL
jgi:aspartate aminotransferase-like enzyme